MPLRRTDGQRAALDSSFTRFLGFAYLPASGHDLELYQADDRISELAEGDTSSWETLWIDLGGEG